MSNASGLAATSRLQNGLLLAVVVAAACLPMLPSLGYELVWDDRMAIGPILDTESIGDWLAVWTSAFDTVLRPGEEGAGYYRPVVVTTLMLDRAVHGDWLPGYHLTNIALYAATCVFLWLFVRELSGNVITATLGAVIYALHPAHAESVCLITGRVDLVAGPPFVAALWLAARGPTPRSDGESGRWHWAPAGVLLIAMFSKEVALLGAPVVALVSWLRSRDAGLEAIVRAALPVALAGAVAVGARLSIPGLSLGREDATAPISLGAELLTGFGALGDYTQWLLSATNLAARHEMPLYTGFDFATGLGIITLIVVTFGLAVGVAARSKWSIAPAIVATTLLPLCWSPLLSSIGVAERLLYIPSAALAVVVALLPLRLAVPLAAIGIGLFAFALPARVAVWSDQTTLFESMLRDSGRTAYLHNVLGIEYTRQDDTARALAHFESARELDPNDPMPLEAMVDLLAAEGRLDEALAPARAWTEVRPQAARGWFMLGAIELALGDSAASVEAYRRALQLAPERAAVHFGLATALVARGQLREALDRLGEAERLDSTLAGIPAFRAELEKAIATSAAP